MLTTCGLHVHVGALLTHRSRSANVISNRVDESPIRRDLCGDKILMRQKK